ncbi:hypothetical protein ASPZODRAFT_68441 [Penicilliopsis zonata CBS 506.65]|uniref:Uncharacterized protein n=1 Tax=Penicilliopsis zonata CBS 506.65 TaxID=1073090 RepID=A0A1L9SEN6_9EURO|nr:hypothetical protein ASPZODRAFT_68441 [Penicilliopsis zonata CBS 506.65]OJJ45629.1 hypothetical protein ASPZODRAFT_68441 [Penicilliopsis zonata CBS 506.65]
MSSMRNAVHRRNHKERGQLEGREKWGILEKHKDYSLRAKDYNVKKAKLKRLNEKARDRNPDEFAFGMMSERSRVQGRHGARDSAEARGLSHEALKLLKTQDAGYLRVVGERVRREMERVGNEIRLQDGMNLAKEKKGSEGDEDDEDDDEEEEEEEEEGFDFDFGTDKKPRKMVFAESREEQQSLKRGKGTDADDDDDDDDDESNNEVDDSLPKSKKQLMAERQKLVAARRARKMKKRASEAREHKLTALKKQHTQIVAAQRELDWQRAKMENSVGGTNKNGIKWKIRERKR